jgi:hypothetical protein
VAFLALSGKGDQNRPLKKKKKTVSASDIINALRKQGKALYGYA